MSLTAMKVIYSEREIHFLKFLRDKYLSKKAAMPHYVQTPLVPIEGDETPSDIKDLISKFERLRLVAWFFTVKLRDQQPIELKI